MSRASLEAAIPEGDRILLDASTLISYLNGGEVTSTVGEHILDSWVRSGRNQAVVSMVSVMEVLVRPLRRGAAPYQTVIDFLTHFPHLEAIPVSFQVAQEAAWVRVTYGFKPPDALTIATGIAAQVGHLATNDANWKRLEPVTARVRVCYLGDHLPFPG